MSGAPVGADELDAALESLAVITRLTARGRGEFDASVERRLSLAYCWVCVGHSLNRYCELRGVPRGSQPFANPIAMRNKLAHQHLWQLADAVLWDTCATNTSGLVQALTQLRASL